MCIDDYLAFCNQFDVGTPELTTCMRNAMDQLSEDCRNALKTEGYNKETESTPETKIQTEDKTVVTQDKPKEKPIVQQKTAKASSRPKKSNKLKTTSQSAKSKDLIAKTKGTIVSYPKRLDVPQSVDSSISVYGAY
ncbi:MAG: hypothetical protein ACKOW3_05460 [Hyphomicrobium sp.]